MHYSLHIINTLLDQETQKGQQIVSAALGSIYSLFTDLKVYICFHYYSFIEVMAYCQ